MDDRKRGSSETNTQADPRGNREADAKGHDREGSAPSGGSVEAPGRESDAGANLEGQIDRAAEQLARAYGYDKEDCRAFIEKVIEDNTPRTLDWKTLKPKEVQAATVFDGKKVQIFIKR